MGVFAMVRMIYTQNYLSLTREALLKELRQVLSSNRYEHVLRVEAKALELAQSYGVDEEKASIAALLHDYAKELELGKMFIYAQKYWPEERLESAGEAIWHGPAAAYLTREKFGCKDPEILQAIACHTTGWFHMIPLVQVIYVADYVEDGRSFPGVDKARKLAFEDLTLAVRFKMIESLRHVISRGVYVYPLSLEIYNNWVTRHSTRSVAKK